MMQSTADYKRSRPLLGTFFEIVLHDSSAEFAAEKVTRAFQEAERLEKVFSKFHESSELTRFNKTKMGTWMEVSEDFYNLVFLANSLWKRSCGSFNPYFPEILDYHFDALEFSVSRVRKQSNLALDLSGIAKGYIVDEIVDFISSIFPKNSGHVNAGGDIRFFAVSEKNVHLKLGSSESPISRSLQISQDAIASSNPSYALDTPMSSSRYRQQFRQGITAGHSVSVIADSCAIADGLTKVALYSDEAITQECAQYFGSQILIFNEHAALQESFGTVNAL